jgi:outer membrane lipoprotein-sorting protein
MPTPITILARSASEAVRARVAFEARQTIRAGKIETVARIRSLAPDRLVVDYDAYTNPLSELGDLWGGNAEFMGSDLVGSSLLYDGRTTWFVNPKTAIALHTAGRHLYEPLPGYDALGETRFLDDLARDFLLRDGGQGIQGGRTTHVIGLKPKRQRVASLFRVATFSFERAEIALDAEALFPLRIAFLPPPSLSSSSFLGSGSWITIEYTDVRELDLDASTFTPTLPAGTRVFEETLVAESELEAALPFLLPVAALRRYGYVLADHRVRLVLDATRERGYATLFCTQEDESKEPTSAIVVRVGNYVSRLMARRRTMAGEHGESVDLGGQPARYLDHRFLWKEGPPDIEVPALADLVWEDNGTFWVLTGEGLAKESLLELARTLS